jgi:hypothetical protein
MRGAAPLAPGGLEPFPRAPSLSSVGPTPSAPFFFPVSHIKPSATPLPLLPPSKLRRDAVPTPTLFLRAAQRVRHQPPLPSTASNCCSGQSFHGISKFPHRGCLPRTGQRSRGFPQLREARRAHPVGFGQPQQAPDATGDPRVRPSIAGLRPTTPSPSKPHR